MIPKIFEASNRSSSDSRRPLRVPLFFDGRSIVIVDSDARMPPDGDFRLCAPLGSTWASPCSFCCCRCFSSEATESIFRKNPLGGDGGFSNFGCASKYPPLYSNVSFIVSSSSVRCCFLLLSLLPLCFCFTGEGDKPSARIPGDASGR